ncbi:MAG: DUF362 domain-containing protein [Proteobacteria bacterium]|nr:DUF362 domain-containing protein [Pseudomonadota bacterium]MBU1741132.1 DUF362 domain-containing protein [Pseudomonadota bacterium]
MHRVLIETADYIDCLPAIRRALDLFPLKISGRKILVKPNVLRAANPDEAITTHPAVIEAVVGCLEQMDPGEIIVGDNPGLMGYGANEAAFRQTGLFAAARGHYRNIGTEAVEVDFNPEYKPRVSLSRAIVEADVIVSVPKFKTHGLTVMTGAIKNSYGLLPGAQKALLHRLAGSPARFHELVVDVFRLRVPDLFIVDAVTAMEGNGPASTDLRQVGRILASDNGVALDGVMARMMGLEPGRLRFLERARELGLGEYDDVEIIGPFETIPDFKLPPLGGEAITGAKEIMELMRIRTKLRPAVDVETCTGCGTCVDQCPVGALTLEDDLPLVDADTCITCFCCQEMCPEKAINLQLPSV